MLFAPWGYATMAVAEVLIRKTTFSEPKRMRGAGSRRCGYGGACSMRRTGCLQLTRRRRWSDDSVQSRLTDSATAGSSSARASIGRRRRRKRLGEKKLSYGFTTRDGGIQGLMARASAEVEGIAGLTRRAPSVSQVGRHGERLYCRREVLK